MQLLLPNPVQTCFSIHPWDAIGEQQLIATASIHLLMTVAAIIRPVVSRVTVMRKGSERGRKREKNNCSHLLSSSSLSSLLVLLSCYAKTKWSRNV